MKRIIYSLLTILLPAAGLLSSCGREDVLFDTPFVFIEAADTSSSGPVNSDQEFVGEYNVYLNGPAYTSNVSVSYEVVPGDGLVEGRDYALVTTGGSLTFLPGIYDMKIRVRWLRTCVRDEDTEEIIGDTLDETRDNTLTIRLTGTSGDYTMGFPGPSGLKRSVTVRKVKAS